MKLKRPMNSIDNYLKVNYDELLQGNQYLTDKNITVDIIK